jgi:hypothetical protein
VNDVMLKALDSKGVIISPQTLVTDQNGLVDCELFTPNFVCSTTPNRNGTLEGDARLSVRFFVDANGDNTANTAEPQNGFDGIPIVEPCPQELIPCALELCRILAEGGVIVDGPALGPTPASVATEATRKPDKEKAERAILKDACRFLEDQIVGFINSGKWDGRFSDLVKRLEHVIKFLRPVERAKPVIERLQCAADILRLNPDVKDIRLSIEEGRGIATVPIGLKETIGVELIGARRRLVTAFDGCTQPELRNVTATGPGTAASVNARELEFEFECLGPGPVGLAVDVLFAPREAIIIEDGSRVDSKLVPRTANQSISPISVDFLLSFRKLIRQDPRGPDIEVFQPRSTAKNEKIPDDQEDAPGAFTIANLDDDNNNKKPDKDETTVKGEEDLIRFRILKSSADKGKQVTFTLQVPAGTAADPAKKITDSVRLWKDPEKNAALGDGRLPEDVTVPADKQEVDVWVEGVEISDAVGDIKIALASGATEHDTVTLTFVWADFQGASRQSDVRGSSPGCRLQESYEPSAKAAEDSWRSWLARS